MEVICLGQTEAPRCKSYRQQTVGFCLDPNHKKGSRILKSLRCKTTLFYMESCNVGLWMVFRDHNESPLYEVLTFIQAGEPVRCRHGGLVAGSHGVDVFLVWFRLQVGQRPKVFKHSQHPTQVPMSRNLSCPFRPTGYRIRTSHMPQIQETTSFHHLYLVLGGLWLPSMWRLWLSWAVNHAVEHPIFYWPLYYLPSYSTNDWQTSSFTFSLIYPINLTRSDTSLCSAHQNFHYFNPPPLIN